MPTKTVGFILAFSIVSLSGLFYRETLTFLPDVMGACLPDITVFSQLFDPGSPVAQQFDLAAIPAAASMLAFVPSRR